VSAPWTCPACKKPVATPFCPDCGESPVHARALTLRELLIQAVQAVTSTDGRVLRTARTLVARPGALTAAYLEGQRKAYLAPLQLFLLANVLFFAVQSLTGVKVFSTSLAMHLHVQPWSGLAQRLVAHRLDATKRALDAYAPLFDHAVALNARSLIVLMVVPFAALPAWLFRKLRRPFAAHLTFALHVYSFLLLLLCVASLVVVVSGLFGAGRDSEPIDHAVALGALALCALHLLFAVARSYGARGFARFFQAAALTVSVAALALGYRFAIFLFTLYTT
jgi:hypothetical protein